MSVTSMAQSAMGLKRLVAADCVVVTALDTADQSGETHT
jgi:hypothetical protein